MLDYLKQICKDQKYVAVYTNPQDSTKFIYGRIISVNSNYIAIYMLSPNGYFDGVIIKQISDVFRIETDSKYGDKIQKLSSLCNEKPYTYTVNNKMMLESLLLIAQRDKQIVSIEILKSGYDDVVGFVDQLKDNSCIVKQIDEYGYEDGMSYIKLTDITQISCNSLDERKLLKLWTLDYKLADNKESCTDYGFFETQE